MLDRLIDVQQIESLIVFDVGELRGQAQALHGYYTRSITQYSTTLSVWLALSYREVRKVLARVPTATVVVRQLHCVGGPESGGGRW